MASIRQFKYPEDYEAVRALWSDSGPGVQIRRSDSIGEIGKKLQRDPHLFLVAEEEGTIVGTVLGGFDGRRGIVYHLAVARSCRRKAIGAALMDELEARLRSLGCIRSYLLVTPENAEAINFYEQRGWERMKLFVFGKDLVE